MSIPRNAQAAWIQTRVEQVYAAADNGQGWKDLSRLWSVTNACALQWAGRHVPADVCKRVGQNGLRAREGKGVRKFAHNKKPETNVHVFKPKPRIETCQHWSYANLQLVQCGAPTTDGKPTCSACAKLESRGAGGQRRDFLRTYIA